MAPLRSLLPLTLLAGLSARAQVPVEPPARNPTPDESWATPAQVESSSGQGARDEQGWNTFPGATAVPEGEAAAGLPRLPEVPPMTVVDNPPGARESRLRPVEPAGPPAVPNRVSLLGARTVGAGRVAAGVSLGFPVVSARVAVGVLPRLDVLAGFDTLYGTMNELRLGGRWVVLEGGARWSVGVVAEGSRAFFLRSASVEDKGARYLSGRRNWNVMPGLVASFQVQGARTPRFFLDARYLVSFDTEPLQRTPLGGLPPNLVTTSSWPVRVGAEVPLSEKTSYSVSLGGDVRSGTEDAAFMPVVSVGIVTGL
ncbi:hypothetical protein LZ198_39970 [Myxococcus sp. K15C18031901]|nr:hypothetical protein [Myxococcus dinghuensis]